MHKAMTRFERINCLVQALRDECDAAVKETRGRNQDRALRLLDAAEGMAKTIEWALKAERAEA